MYELHFDLECEAAGQLRVALSEEAPPVRGEMRERSNTVTLERSKTTGAADHQHDGRDYRRYRSNTLGKIKKEKYS